MNGSGLPVVRVDQPAGEPPLERPSYARVDEPVMPTPEHQELWRKYVEQMERESNPSRLTTISISIRELARDHVVSLIADQTGEPKARQAERDRRKIALLKEINTSARHADSTEGVSRAFITGFVAELVGLTESRLGHEPELAARIRKEIAELAVSYTRKAFAGGRSSSS